MTATKVSDPVPLVSSLDSIYSPAGVLKNSSRWNQLASAFSSAFHGDASDFIARAPGRVNLIGEHIDYVGFSVFPAAIEKDILMATKVHYASSPADKVEPTRLPPSSPDHTFVIVNTLVVSDKKVTGPVNYNLRVVETRMAARALANYLGLQGAKRDGCKDLRGVLETYFEENGGSSRLELEMQNSSAVKETLEKSGEEAARIKVLEEKVDALYSKLQQGLRREEVEKLTGYSGSEFEQEFLSSFPIRAEAFELYKRSKHVFTESLRVLQFQALCNQHASLSSPEENTSVYKQLGALMDGSQASLRDLYNCSCDELNQVVDIAKRNGSLGSRLTGAGWGGCTVHLVPKPKVEVFISAMRTQFYAKRWPELTEEQFEDACFDTQPAGGACVYQV
ncbi:hypothetical protein NDA16_001573 [Ustilago loliicola]|nr:hypothetical protein NDA16_001573 [Ustilago loliicola]